ncbi:flagellar assembly protein FliH [Oceanobacillus longus]|uniref:Flagellar assembly protein FliH n=1 Tax=Oceanobacillus longus TaxID=930120 RepID=A0ABV8GTI5_9BACI
MSESENNKYPNQKLIKIKPIELPRKDPEYEPIELEKNREVIQQRIESMKQELLELAQKKQQLIDQTNQMILQEKENWQEEKEQLIRDAKQEGYAAGFDKGKIDGHSEYRDKLQQANLIIDATTNDYHATIEKSDEAILQLAVSIAAKILNHQISATSSSFMEIVKRAIKEIKDQSVVTINLHPTNFDFVMQHKEELRRSLEKDTKLSIYIDERLAENACLIEHPFGQIDASVDTQLIKIQEALQDYLMEKKS